MIQEGDAGHITEDQETMLNQAFASCQRMVYIISDLLNVSRIRTGKFNIDRTSVDLDYVVKDEIDQLKEIAKSLSVEIAYSPPEAVSPLYLDETKTRQVIMNFLDNALYYTPPGGLIKVNLINTEASVELRIKDNGMGVPRSEQHHLFTKFYRATNARKARPDGTGLGLFMAKKIVIAEGGAIVFDSQEGKGSTFGFIFPKSNELSTAPEQE
jgi:signal transduction histidine kinase